MGPSRVALASIGAALMMLAVLSFDEQYALAGLRRRLQSTVGMDDEGGEELTYATAGEKAAEAEGAAVDAALLDVVTGHKYLSPLNGRDVAGLIFASLGLIIAAGGGIGGGGMLVPIFIIVLGFKPKFAIPLSNVTVLGGAIVNVWFGAQKRHPSADRPLVDWDLIMVMQPAQLVGALLGAFINKVSPEIVLTAMLVVLLGLTADKTLRKAFQMYAKETAAAKAKESELVAVCKAEAEEEEEAAGVGLLSGDSDSLEAAKRARPEELVAILAEEATTPLWKAKALALMFSLIIVANLSKGGGSFASPLGILCGSASYWGMTLLMLGYLVGFTRWVRNYLIAMTKTKRELGFKYHEGDIVWDERGTIRYPLICIGAGLCAGLFGIGGGIVTGPLMLELGIHPQVAGASTAVMILFTAFTAATSFILFGLLQWDYAGLLFVVGLAATYVGQTAVNYLMKKYNRNSYIAFSIGAVVAISAVFMTIQSMLHMAYEGVGEVNGSICGSE